MRASGEASFKKKPRDIYKVRKEWLEWYVWDKVRARIIVEQERGKILDLVVQLEVNDDGWKAVVRYDLAHGKPHKDLIHKDGQREKIWFAETDLKKLLTSAELDMRKNWKTHLRECGYLEFE